MSQTTTMTKEHSIPSSRLSDVVSLSSIEDTDLNEIDEILFVSELDCQCCCHGCINDYLETETYLFEHFW